jgi:methylmalonyl-CoA mutase
VVGITGTGGAGKSSLTDELLRASCATSRSRRIAVLAVDPTRRRTGGALLGDRIRMNSARLARTSTCARWPRAASTSRPAPCSATSACSCSSLGFDLVIVETAGIGQSDSEIVDLVDFRST